MTKVMMMRWTNRYEKKKLLLGKDRRERERNNTSAMFARRCLLAHPSWPHICVFTRKRNHECDACEKSFRRSDDLKKHMRIHTNEKAYECDVCEMKFRHSSALKNHM